MAQFLQPPETVTGPVPRAENLPAAGESGKLPGERCSLSEPSLLGEVIAPLRPFRIRPSSEEDPHAALRPIVFPASAHRGPAIPRPPLRPESVTISDSPGGSALSPGEIRPHPCGQSAGKAVRKECPEHPPLRRGE